LNLRWPADFTAFNPEVSTNLTPADNWQTVAGPYFLSNGWFGISVPATAASQQFFRLRKPMP